MRPLTVTARNLRTWQHLKLTVEDGVHAIVGANGAGKSTLVNALELALFAGRGELARQLTAGEGECYVALEFEHDGTRYRVRRTYTTASGGRSTTTLERLAERGRPGELLEWEQAGAESQTQTQTILEGIIGMSRDTFRASVFLAQGDGGFADADPRERRRVLHDLLGLERWSHLHETAGEAWKDADTDRQRLAAVLERDRTELEALAGTDPRGQLKQVNEQLARAEALAEKAGEHAAEAQAEAEAQRALRDDLTNAERAVDRAAARLAEAGVAVATARVRREAALAAGERAAKLADVPARLEAAVREHAEQAALADAARRAADALAVAQTRLQDARTAATDARARARDAYRRYRGAVGRVRALRASPAPTCEACGQTLDAAEYLEHARRGLVLDALELRRAWHDEHGRAADADERLDAAERGPWPVIEQAPTVEQLAALAEVVDALRQQDADRKHAEAERERGGEWLARGADAEQAVADAEREKAEAEAWLGRATAKAAGIDPAAAERRAAEFRDLREARVREHAQLAASVPALEAAVERLEALDGRVHDGDVLLERLEDRCSTLELLRRAYHPTGIPTMILETAALPAIERYSNDALRDLGRAFTVELRTVRATKAGGERDALDVIVHTPAGELPYQELSGGERTRVNVALRLALARLLGRGGCRMLVVDEPSFLDEDGFAQLARMLRERAAEFGSVYVVSHVPGLRDAFDRTLEVVGGGDTGEPSRVAS